VRALILLVVVAPSIVGAQETMPAPFGEAPFGKVPEELSQAGLEAATNSLLAADQGAIYSVRMKFSQPAELKAVREAAVHLQIPRVLAFVELFSPTGIGRPVMLPPIGLGMLYENAGAWEREVCRAKIYSGLSGAMTLAASSPESWPVTEISVYGSGYAIREFEAGTLLPPARVTEGFPQEQQHLQALNMAVQHSLSQPITVPDNISVPAECRDFASAIDGPILSGQRNASGRQPRGPDLDFRAVLQEQLSRRAPDTPVTLRLSFGSEVRIETLAALVEQYRIDGLLAELVPENGDERVIGLVEFSVHGGPMASQVRRAQCQRALASAQYSVAGEWYTRRAQVSLAVAGVWALLSAQNLRDVELVADFAPGSLSRIEAYHRRKSEEPISTDLVTNRPAGC